MPASGQKLLLLLDENLPVALRHLISNCDVRSAAHMGWSGIENGALIAAAENAGFDALVTADRNMRYQQNLTARRIALIVLPSPRFDLIRVNIDRITTAIRGLESGSFIEVDFPRGISASQKPPGQGH